MAAAANGKKEVLDLLIKENATLDLKSEADDFCANDLTQSFLTCTETLSYGVT